ncbi:tetratricopeptide repeat domain protein [[Synechococcus] sp. NIES-970]|nr:tetratricopeptide repeat domain protein [[Synechococcus] sp. NIES-970]
MQKIETVTGRFPCHCKRVNPMTNRYRKLLLFLSLGLMLGMGKVSAASLMGPIWDPLLPIQQGDRPLNETQIAQLEQAVIALEEQGFALWAAGEKERAIALLVRQLRLRQVLPDRRAEIESLGKVGAIAWEDNETTVVKSITERLVTIERQDFPGNYRLLLPLATAYEQIREIQPAIALYRQHLDTLEDPYKPEILRLIAQLATDWFRTDDALAALEDIAALNALTIADQEQLATLYEQSDQLEKAIAHQQELAAFYLQDQAFLPLIRTSQRLAHNYQARQDYSQAISFSRNAFTLAWEMRYFEAAENTLKQLADLYLAQGRDTAGTQVYEQLLTVQNASYNRFGMMETYRTLADLYQQTDRNSDALIALQNGLAIAEELNHNINDFTEAIDTLSLQ